MKKKKTKQKERIVCDRFIVGDAYISFFCDKDRVLDCWVKDKSFMDGSLFDAIREEDVDYIKDLVIPNIAEYWAMGKIADYAGYSELRRCITIFNPSWRKQIKKNVSS